MKRSLIILSAALLFAGCKTQQGGIREDSEMDYGAGRGLGSETGSGPTYKPGNDIRDFNNPAVNPAPSHGVPEYQPVPK